MIYQIYHHFRKNKYLCTYFGTWFRMVCSHRAQISPEPAAKTASAFRRRPPGSWDWTTWREKLMVVNVYVDIIHLSIYLSIYIYLSIHPSIYRSYISYLSYPFYLSYLSDLSYLSIVFIYLSYLSIYLINLSISFIYLSYLSIYLNYLSILFIYLILSI